MMRSYKNAIQFLLGFSFLCLSLFGLAVPGHAQFSSADLVIVSLSTLPVSPEPGTMIQLVAVIANKGRSDVLQGFTVRFKMDGLLYSDRRIDFGLSVDKEEQISLPWPATEGDHTLTVQLDPYQDVEESNEFNNTADYAFSVRRPGAIRSITFDIVDSIGKALNDSGTAIQLQFTTDTYTLVNAFQKAFQATSNNFSAGESGIVNLTAALPANLQSEDQIQASKQVSTIYGSLSGSFKQSSDALLSLNLQVVPAIFQQIEEDMTQMSNLAIDGVSYKGLKDTVPLFESALDQVKVLQDYLAGKQVNLTVATQQLVDILTQIGKLWVQVGKDSTLASQAQTPLELNSQGQSANSYRAGDALTFAMQGATHLKIEIFNKTGSLVYSKESDGSQFTWDGKGSDGKTLSADHYYCRLTATDSSSKTHINILQILIGS
ncbi:gliding motility-associated C-terminal domain-containing protein [Candidatus Acetothermia bacterium]|nr:gliding motility-associated C-terminal domain-containing protein [Candidatus Acetothermia bacterium]MBI3642594.1 gliding motility-associated C-terminal domain-containing protein [Candidatus Acetothermia bacterium]